MLLLSVAMGLKEAIKGKNCNEPLMVHLNSIGLDLSSTPNVLSLKLRELTVKEWLGSNRSYYESFLSDSIDIETDAEKFLHPNYVQGSLGDAMVLALYNILCSPMIIFSTIPNQHIIPLMPQNILCDSLVSVAFNHTGPGHYDAVIPKQLGQKVTKVQSVHCRCGVNGDGPSCTDNESYKTRCKCHKLKLACTKACNCKNCVNSFGRRVTLGKRVRGKHSKQITLPDSKKFAEERSEKLMHGSWTSLENSIFIFVIEDFQDNAIEISVDHVLQAFNEIVILSSSTYNSVTIPDNLMKPNQKSFNQMNGKLQHYFKEMAILHCSESESMTICHNMYVHVAICTYII